MAVIMELLLCSILILCLTDHQAEVLAIVTRDVHFFRNPNPTISTGSTSPTPSRANSPFTCAMHCLDNPTCFSYLHNSTTGVCQESATPDPLVTSLSNGLGDLYVTCDTSLGYFYYQYGNEAACIMPVTTSSLRVNYTQAIAYCTSQGGFLASVKTWEKLQLLIKSIPDNKFWVGMDDLADEGIYVWVEDNSVAFTTPDGLKGRDVSHTYMPNMWDPNEPNNYDEEEHCIQVKYSSSEDLYLLNDYKCGQSNRFPCEKKIKFV